MVDVDEDEDDDAGDDAGCVGESATANDDVAASDIKGC